jgi:NADH pyrophosphatase NudC (nudix superfamily)
MLKQPALFETHAIRRAYDEKTETWWFSVIDIIQVLPPADAVPRKVTKKP